MLAASFLSAQEGCSQFIDYAGFSGGVGSCINTHDASLLNHYNPRRIGPELNFFVGRHRKRLGWQAGVTYRDVRHFTLGKLYDPAKPTIDTVRKYDDTGFILLPLYLTYRVGNPKWTAGLRAGLYGGWKIHAYSELIAPSGVKYNTPVDWTRFPTPDTFGGQGGLELMYRLNRKVSLYTEARLIIDASDLIFPNYHNYTNTYAGYRGRTFTVGLTYNLL
ncbi:hypothetical protein [Persicitalea jodogahamensis]|uniref:Outer membrane protein beta-barrel domain-containing protein n=1 Tax=Persicitalea jodogahamensis TaxID=402147 RepID=A0A8J3D2M0_9BACT|nr:hypothetical protein [Persicitalea jodogahamensis]GHB70873.1 hypothetical protein GCM10007390_25740 [Persicitalea jodogahamensis]